MVTHKSLRQLRSSLFRSANNVGWIKRTDYQHFHFGVFARAGREPPLLENHGDARRWRDHVTGSNAFPLFGL
jgi:hypothetical protein